MTSIDLYFWFSKVANGLLMPSTLFLYALVLSFALSYTPYFRAGRKILTLALLGAFAVGVVPSGTWLLNVLENRFAAVKNHDTPVTGIIVLGGSFDTLLSAYRDQVAVGANVERLTEFMRLGRLYPDAKLVFTGGIGLIGGEGPTEAKVAKRFFMDLNFQTDRILFEGKSRNTAESAVFTVKELQPQAGENWILITSARHMPRAVGYFRSAGWSVIAHPVDYITPPELKWALKWPPSFNDVNGAAYEWGGLFVGWLRGRIDEPFPGPLPVAQQ